MHLSRATEQRYRRSAEERESWKRLCSWRPLSAEEPVRPHSADASGLRGTKTARGETLRFHQREGSEIRHGHRQAFRILDGLCVRFLYWGWSVEASLRGFDNFVLCCL